MLQESAFYDIKRNNIYFLFPRLWVLVWMVHSICGNCIQQTCKNLYTSLQM